MRRFSIGLALALATFNTGCTDDNPNAVGAPDAGPQQHPTVLGDMAGVVNPNQNPNQNPPPNDMATPPPDPVHALGRIELGESHQASGGSATPVVSAGFSPTAAAPVDCSTTIAGCQVLTAPNCGAPCGSGQYCSYDSSCTPQCTKACTMSCATGEECYFPAPNTPACRAIQTFDAGALAFSGTTTSLTLYPPYTFSGSQSGAPFLAGGQIEVQGSGAAMAGFDKFDEKFVATSFLQTSPRINKISRGTIFGTGSVQIGWAPGSDTVVITLSGLKGSATCKGSDASGTYTISRDVLDAILDDVGTPSLAMSVKRSHSDVRMSEATKGSLVGTTVPSTGWLTLSTSSTEMASFTGCTSTQMLCGNDCSTLQYDAKHCGSCDNVCAAGDTCAQGVCAGPTACAACVGPPTMTSGACKTQTDTCTADTACNTLRACVRGCTAGDATCFNNCETASPTGATKYSAIETCLCGATVCQTQCEGGCMVP